MQHKESDWDRLPQGAIEMNGGIVSAMNAAARRWLPGVDSGSPLPDSLARELSGPEGAGSFVQEGQTFLFTRLTARQGEVVVFYPARQSGLSGAQLEGFSRQMRRHMGELANRLDVLSARQGEQADPQLSGLNRNFHQMLRLVSDMEFLNIPQEEAQAQFAPTAVDLAGLCRELVRQAAPMLRKAGVELTCDCPASLLVPGDPELIRRMLLALISNAAKAAPGGRVELALRALGDRAVIAVTDTGCSASEDLAALLREGPGEGIPAPGQGSGMGLSVARRIAALHGGALLAREGGEGGTTFAVSLPVRPLPARLPLRTPGAERDGGLSPILVGLADVLPGELFEMERD